MVQKVAIKFLQKKVERLGNRKNPFLTWVGLVNQSRLTPAIPETFTLIRETGIRKEELINN